MTVTKHMWWAKGISAVSGCRYWPINKLQIYQVAEVNVAMTYHIHKLRLTNILIIFIGMFKYMQYFSLNKWSYYRCQHYHINRQYFSLNKWSYYRCQHYHINRQYFSLNKWSYYRCQHYHINRQYFSLNKWSYYRCQHYNINIQYFSLNKWSYYRCQHYHTNLQYFSLAKQVVILQMSTL